MILKILNITIMVKSRMANKRTRFRLRRDMAASKRKQQKKAKMMTGKMLDRAKMERNKWLRKLKKRGKRRSRSRVKRKRRRCPR